MMTMHPVLRSQEIKMRIDTLKTHLICLLGFLLLLGCNVPVSERESTSNSLPPNALDFRGTPTSSIDRSSLAFSDQGAWFAYGLPGESAHFGGFTGPFLMTQENGVWIGRMLSRLDLADPETEQPIDWSSFAISQNSFNSHLEQEAESESLRVSQTLYFSSANSAVIATHVENLSNETIRLRPQWKGSTFLGGLQFERSGNGITIHSAESTATGSIQLPADATSAIHLSDTSYAIDLEELALKPGEVKQLLLAHTFIFPEYDIKQERSRLNNIMAGASEELLQRRIHEKRAQLESLYSKLDTVWKGAVYKDFAAKTLLTLQNNWRVPAGELKHAGLFPSYHYIWFHGFWAWDSWKHAAALAQYDTHLAKEQIRAMYDFQTHTGFIAVCVYRDTTIERHNHRNTKPPLSAWAVWKVFEQDRDEEFLRELYPQMVKQHNWWYAYRDHDGDGICEYGSTDGSLIAAKWESGMDNAVRFDSSRIVQNGPGAFSLNQESVDLNAYLFAEKRYLGQVAATLGKSGDAAGFQQGAEALKRKIQTQFYDANTNWFYDTTLDGERHILAMGCEGWLPLWAKVATPEQAEGVKNNMMNPEFFNTAVPFQTLSAAHPEFNPDGGYWRGPNWLDQSYFGVMGLHNYGHHQEAHAATYKLFHNADGALSKGNSIRENYQPMTGAGLEAENFSWSAAHCLLLLLNE